MHNPKTYRATFRDLIATVFKQEQVLKLKIELTMYQESDSPERWTFTPTIPTGRPHLHAATPVALAKLIEECFVHRDSEWLEDSQQRRLFRPKKIKRANVIEFPSRRSA